MNKKVLSAILFSALFAGTGTFTSCIDTDEPAGIEELRGAKAELIRAKVAVEQAEAARILAVAEVEKANAAIQAAIAKQEEAKAKLEEAKAEAQEAATAEAKAYAEKMVAQYQNEMKEAALTHEAELVNLQKALAVANRQYELTLAQIEIAKQLFPFETYVELSKLQDDVEDAKGEVEDAVEALADAKADYDAAAVDYKYKGEIQKKRLENAVAKKEGLLAAAKEELAKWEGFLENDVETADWRAEVDSLEALVESLEKENSELELEKTKLENSDEYKALLDSKDEAAKDAAVDSVYGYKYYDVYEGKLKEFAKALTYNTKNGNVYSGAKWEETKAVDSLDAIKADLAASVNLIKTQKTDDSLAVLTFTAYKKDLLDTVAAYADKTAKQDSAEIANIVKAWETALANYKAGKDIERVSSIETAAGTFITSMTPAAAGATIGATTMQTAVTTFATALSTAYGKLPAGQFKYTEYTLIDVKNIKTIATAAKDKKMTIGSILSDTNKYFYLAQLLKEFGFVTWKYNETLENVTIALTDDGKNKTKYDLKFAPKKDALANSVINSFVQKEKEGTDVVAENITASDTTLLGKLIVASAEAFGESKLYLQGAHSGANLNGNVEDKLYLTVKPTVADIKYVFTQIINSNTTVAPTYENAHLYEYGKLGKYGASVTASIDEFVAYAKNYKAYLANLEGAVAYWEKVLETLDSAYTAWETAKEAAEDKLTAYSIENIQPLFPIIKTTHFIPLSASSLSSLYSNFLQMRRKSCGRLRS